MKLDIRSFLHVQGEKNVRPTLEGHVQRGGSAVNRTCSLCIPVDEPKGASEGVPDYAWRSPFLKVRESAKTAPTHYEGVQEPSLLAQLYVRIEGVAVEMSIQHSGRVTHRLLAGCPTQLTCEAVGVVLQATEDLLFALASVTGRSTGDEKE